MKLLDFLLFPKKFFDQLSGRIGMLVLGMIFIGILDMAIIAIDNYEDLFINNEYVVWNILILVFLSVIIGVIDVAFFGIPLFDLFKVFRKEREIQDVKTQRIKLFKVYIVSHTVILPIEIALHLVIMKSMPKTVGTVTAISNPAATAVLLLLYPLLIVWFNAIITRGINTIYKFQPLFRSLVFPVVLIWNFFLGEAISYMQLNWFTKLFFM